MLFTKDKFFKPARKMILGYIIGLLNKRRHDYTKYPQNFDIAQSRILIHSTCTRGIHNGGMCYVNKMLS